MTGDAKSAERPLTLLTPIESVPGVTRAGAEGFRAMGIPTLAHLIHHIPFRHERLEGEARIEELKPGAIVSARGEITATRLVTHGRRPRFEAVLMDESGRLDLVFFNQTYLSRRLSPGTFIRVQGKANRRGPTGKSLQLVNPKWWEVKSADEAEDGAGASSAEPRLRPVYPASEAVPSSAIDRVIQGVLVSAMPLIEDHLPAEHRRERALPELREAYRMIHSPKDEAEVKEAVRRLVYDELLMLQLGVRMKRAYVRKSLHAPALRWSRAIDEHIRARLPFKLTAGQERAVSEVVKDLQAATPANRLIQGDVGSGKTAVALYAMLMAAASKHQAALMAPTELLAEQHYATISAMLAGSNVKIELFTGESRRAGEPTPTEFDIAIGTHALLSERVKFESLAVAVIDEQHRFGVHQRAQLREKSADASSSPHVLVMTATPIPRTLALTIFGDLDVSTIKGLPPGRVPIVTRVVPEVQAPTVYDFVRGRIEKGEQAYIVVPAIDGGEESAEGLRAVRPVMRMLEEGPLKGLRVAAVHGKLKQRTRETIMGRFRAGMIDALVATSVIEVGVDVPNASVMVVNHADRFGLAQLHQLRGRVGRGTRRSVCVFIHNDEPTPEARERLKALSATTDGFKLAETDLEIRGPGEVIGARQAGTAPFRLAEFPRDLELLLLAKRDAEHWIERSPTLMNPTDRLLRTRLFKSHAEDLGLSDIA